jgi:hypothetical protein
MMLTTTAPNTPRHQRRTTPFGMFSGTAQSLRVTANIKVASARLATATAPGTALDGQRKPASPPCLGRSL